jgi:hypothetical protein
MRESKTNINRRWVMEAGGAASIIVMPAGIIHTINRCAPPLYRRHKETVRERAGIGLERDEG